MQEDLWKAKDNIRSRCDIAWEFLSSTSAIEETVAIVRAQVQEELDRFAANEKVQALTTDDRAFVLEELHQYAKNLKFLVTSVCDVLPDIIDEFEAIAGRLLDDNEEVKVSIHTTGCLRAGDGAESCELIDTAPFLCVHALFCFIFLTCTGGGCADGDARARRAEAGLIRDRCDQRRNPCSGKMKRVCSTTDVAPAAATSPEPGTSPNTHWCAVLEREEADVCQDPLPPHPTVARRGHRGTWGCSIVACSSRELTRAFASQEAIRGYKEAALDAIDDVLAITIPGAHDLKSAKQLVNEVALIQYEGQRLLEKLPFSNRTAITMAQVGGSC